MQRRDEAHPSPDQEPTDRRPASGAGCGGQGVSLPPPLAPVGVQRGDRELKKLPGASSLD